MLMRVEIYVTFSYKLQRIFHLLACKRVLIRYHFDDESVQIWQSEALETSRRDPSVQRPCQGFGGTPWAESGPRRVAPAQAEAGASSCAAWQNCRRLERGPRAVASECDPYRNSSSCAPEAPKHGAE